MNGGRQRGGRGRNQEQKWGEIRRKREKVEKWRNGGIPSNSNRRVEKSEKGEGWRYGERRKKKRRGSGSNRDGRRGKKDTREKRSKGSW